MSSDQHEDEAMGVPGGGPTAGGGGLARRDFVGVLAALGAPGLAAGGALAQSDVDSQVASIVDGTSLDEKLHYTHGQWQSGMQTTGYVPAMDQLGVPEIKMIDGPVGARMRFQNFESEETTAFPATVAAAASFDPDLAYEQGRAMAREAKAVDQHCLLGPGLNVHRVPTGGRLFEYYSEDPYLTARMAANATSGIQDENVVATPKHYVANNHEENRREVSAEVSERALREIYLPGFKAAVQEGGAGAVMSAYNRVNGTHCTEHEHLLTEILKEEWGFDGYVVSDWGAMGSTVASANAGQDLEMNTAEYYGDSLGSAVQSGEVPESRVTEMAERVLRPYARTGHLDGDLGPGAVNTTEHQTLARDIAEQGAVLLKNEGDVLPIDETAVDRIAVVGPVADQAVVGGGGSSDVLPPYEVTPLQAIEDYVGDAATIDSYAGTDPDQAASTASGADVALAFGHIDSSEFEDREDMHLDGQQDDLIGTVASENPNTVAVLRIPGPIVMPWLGDVAGVLNMWYPGLEDGTATANVLFGETNPSGKLPTTFGQSFEDYPVSESRRYPGENQQAHYEEGVFVGYRHFDENGVEPLFPFGFGLSYTTFEYGDTTLLVPEGEDTTSATVDVPVTNTGDVAGAETVQIYFEAVDPAVPRPPRELKGFDKVWLEPGETAAARIGIDAADFEYWDPDAGAWTRPDGEHRIHVAASSRDVRDSITVGTGEGSTCPDGVDAPAPVDGVSPQDLNGDGRHRDLNANCRLDSDDVVTYFEHMDDAAIRDNVGSYDYNGNERIDFDDVVTLFESL